MSVITDINIAVIGAGLAGLRCASLLAEKYCVTLYEKSRGIGGRLATRRAGDYQFDHGAQYFTVKSPEFELFLEPYIDRGDVTRWDADFVELSASKIDSARAWSKDFPHYVGSPTMNQLAKVIAEPLTIQRSITINHLTSQAGKWHLNAIEADIPEAYDWVVLAMPVTQALALLPENFRYINKINQIKMAPCYSLMLGFDLPIPLDWQAALVHTKEISWVTLNHTKPGRKTSSSVLVNSTNSWAAANLELSDEAVIKVLQSRLVTLLGDWVLDAAHVGLQRWRYANAIKQQGGKPAYIDSHLQLAVCGDWCIHGRVEAAFLSGSECGKILQQSISDKNG